MLRLALCTLSLVFVQSCFLLSDDDEETNPQEEIDPEELAKENGYSIGSTEDIEANSCEFYIDSFGKGLFSGGTSHLAWLESTIIVNRERLAVNDKNKDKFKDKDRASVRGAGIYLRIDNQNYWHYGDRTGTDAYRVKFITEQYSSAPGRQIAKRHPDRIAFFVDLIKPSGTTQRIWYRNNGVDFTLDSIFIDGDGDDFPIEKKSLGEGWTQFVKAPSPVFKLRETCI